MPSVLPHAAVHHNTEIAMQLAVLLSNFNAKKQVGAFVQAANVDKVAEGLREENFSLFILTSRNGALYLVHVGPYADEESARIAQSELKTGFRPSIRY